MRAEDEALAVDSRALAALGKSVADNVDARRASLPPRLVEAVELAKLEIDRAVRLVGIHTATLRSGDRPHE